MTLGHLKSIFLSAFFKKGGKESRKIERKGRTRWTIYSRLLERGYICGYSRERFFSYQQRQKWGGEGFLTCRAKHDKKSAFDVVFVITDKLN